MRYSGTGKWFQISSSKPKWITTGKVAAAVHAAGSLSDPMDSAGMGGIVDLSQEWPGDAASGASTLETDGPVLTE